jgi:TPR repeat protein
MVEVAKPVLALAGGLVALTGAALADPVEEARQLYLSGDYAAALPVLRPLAEAGDASAQNVMGNAYFYGLGVDQDCAQALDWMEKAAGQGLDRAHFNLARYRDTGCYGAGQDPVAALHWYRRAQAAEVAPSYLYLAVLLAEGRAGAGDPAEIETLLAAARDAGIEDAGVALARLLASGTGLPADRDRARELLFEAAAGGAPEALRGLGQYYLPEDPAAAHALFSEALDIGSQLAAVDLAEMQVRPGTYWYDPVQAWALCLWSMRRAGPEWSGEVTAACERLKGEVSTREAMAAAIRAEGWD